MPSFLSSTIAILATANIALATAPVCSSSIPFSCTTTAKEDTCCFETPGGQVLQTQFWDTDPPTGPTNSWTIHGLWPDNCDGSFQEDCDAARDYTNISAILTAAGRTDVLSLMNQFWLNDPNDGSNEEFWEHEWATHGTCYSTLQPDCFTDYQPQEEVVDFFAQVVTLFQTLPTFEWLSNADITPSSSKTYTEAEILAALKAPRGVSATLECDGSDLSEVYYTFNVQGSIANGVFQAVNPTGEGNGCPSDGIKYLPKSS